MEYINGVPISDIEEIKRMGLDLRDVCHVMIDCFSNQIYKYGFVHSDPHPGMLFFFGIDSKEISLSQRKLVRMGRNILL